MRGIFAVLCMIQGLVFADIGPQGFHNHPNRYFVETGSYVGGGIQKALEAGFQVILSLEIDNHFFSACSQRFASNPQVHLWLKDSSKDLYDIIQTIDEPITFWLDGHTMYPENTYSDGSHTPVLKELEQIKRHKIKTHTIMIDDIRCCNTVLFDYITLNDIIKKVLEINPNYTITFESGMTHAPYPNDVLVASIR